MHLIKELAYKSFYDFNFSKEIYNEDQRKKDKRMNICFFKNEIYPLYIKN